MSLACLPVENADAEKFCNYLYAYRAGYEGAAGYVTDFIESIPKVGYIFKPEAAFIDKVAKEAWTHKLQTPSYVVACCFYQAGQYDKKGEAARNPWRESLSEVVDTSTMAYGEGVPEAQATQAALDFLDFLESNPQNFKANLSMYTDKFNRELRHRYGLGL